MSPHNAPFRIPFCAPFIIKNLSNKLNSSQFGNGNGSVDDGVMVWNVLPNECQTSTIIIGSIGGILLLMNLICNILMVVTSFATKPLPPETKDDEVSRKHYSNWKSTIAIGRMFRISLALSGILLCGLLVPFITTSGYQLFSSQAFYLPSSVTQYTEHKEVACAVFHVVLSSTIFSTLGAVIERWVTIFRLNPEVFLDRKRKPLDMSHSENGRRQSLESNRPSQRKSRRKSFSLVFIYVAWMISIAFGVASVKYGEVRLFFFAEDLRNNEIKYASLFGGFVYVPSSTMLGMSAIYIICLYLPLFVLIILLVVTLCCLFKVQSKSERLPGYDEACFRSEFGKQQIGASNHKAVVDIHKNSTTERRSPTIDAVYSHRAEHARQVASNCQGQRLDDIMTDCIQIENDDGIDGGQESNMPPPPDWIAYPSIGVSRYSSISTVQVPDLAQTAAAVSIDSARSFFGETSETRATLAYCAISGLSVVPACTLLAFDIFTGNHSIFNDGPAATLSGVHTAYENAILPSHTASSLGAVSFALFLLGGAFPFIILYVISKPFKKAIKRLQKKNKNHKTRETVRPKRQSTKLPEIREDTPVYAKVIKTATAL